MEMKDYVQTVVNKFESKNFDEESQLRASEKLLDLKSITDELVEICKRLDDVKRHIFYKKGELTGQVPSNELTIKEFRILHAAVGLATEGTEFLEAAVNGILDGNLDETHLIEELSDIFWYGAVFTDVSGTSFEQVADANVAKLNIRYALKFSNDRALTRDLPAERAALEAATKKPNLSDDPEWVKLMEQGREMLKADGIDCPVIRKTDNKPMGVVQTGTFAGPSARAQVITFPIPDAYGIWEEDIKAKYLKFGATLILIALGFSTALFGPMFLSRLF